VTLAVGCSSSPPSAAEANVDSCSSICACAGGQGVDQASCMAACKQVSVASANPAQDCRSDLGSASAASCDSHCGGLQNPVPQDSLGRCGADGVGMSVGEELKCDLSGEMTVDYLALSVGCNDGETGNFTATFDDGTKVSLFGDCGTAHYLSPAVHTGHITLTMDSGGGKDGNISFTDYGSYGLVVGYR
ncbi:MAG TPA: hypothetical protein VIF09_12200, partial [Polyangiaceae bacterium]